MNTAAERRRTRRYPVTLSAKITYADRTHRAAIIDLGAGGVLLAISRYFHPKVGCSLDIDATLIGRFQARVVDISRHGIHLEVENMTAHYEQALGKISRLTNIWP